MSPPAMNTRSKKHLAIPPADQLDNEKILIDTSNFFTLPNMLDDKTYIHMIQRDTCLYDISDLEPEDIAERMRIKKKQALKRWMRRIRRTAEIQARKVKQLRRELRLAHKKSKTEDGKLGIVWWSREYWDDGKGQRRYTVKKEEPVTPIWWGQDYNPSTLMLTYPSLTPTSRYQSMDPNDFVWSPVYRPSPM